MWTRRRLASISSPDPSSHKRGEGADGRSVRRVLVLLATAAVSAVALAAAIGLLAGYRPAVVEIDLLASDQANAAEVGRTAHRVVIVSPRNGGTITPGDELLIEGDVGLRLVLVTEVEPDSADGLLSTIVDNPARGDGPSLYPLQADELAVRWTLPGWMTSVPAAVERSLAGVLTVLVLFWLVRATSRLWHHGADRAERPMGKPRSAVVRLRTMGVVVVVVGVLTAGAASALFVGSDTAAGNQFGTGCFDAQVAQVQTGQATNSTEGTQSVTVTTVDPARSVVFVTVRSSSDEPADSMVMATLASSTQLELVRRTDDPSPPTITIDWTVVEYGCGVTVQRGTVAGNGTGSMDVSLAAVDTAASFVVTSSVTDRADAAHDGDDDHLAALVDGTTLRISSASGGTLPADHSYAWQVVSFDDPGDVQVQTATQTLSGTNTETVTLGTAVDPEATLVLAHAASAGSGADIGERLARVHLSSATTVEVTRLLAGDALEVSMQVITFAEGTVVQHGVVNLGIGEAAATIAVTPVDSARASALSTVLGPGSFSGGASTMASSAVLGEASGTFEVTDPTTVTVTRNATTATASFGWQLVEWGGPSWWDSAYSFRQRIDVATSSTSAPGAYSVPVTIDHAALVTSGLARSDGTDLRVLRWDGSAWNELDRVLGDGSAWNDAATTVWFRTTDAIAAGITDSYWLYYGDDTPASPLEDPENVWLLHEDFESGTLGDFEDRTAGTGWYQAQAWTARIPLTVQSSLVDANLNDFPVLVELTDASLGAGAQADGDDIRFTEADGVTPLDHELESWNSATGAISAWVRLPTVSSSVDTDFYLLYGASDAPDQQNTTAVWENGSGIWHLQRDPAGAAPQVDDSSAARHDGLSAGTMTSGDLVAGRIGQAVDHDGVDDRLDIEPFDLFGKTLTVSGWVRPDSLTGDQLLVGKTNDAGDLILALGTTGTQARVELRVGGTTRAATGGGLTVAKWTHLAATWNGSTLELFVDGLSVGSTPVSGSLHRDATMPVSIGDTPANDRPLDGAIDEVRIESTVRSSDWLMASMQNQSGPTSFVVSGSTEVGTWFGQGTWSYRKPLAVDAGTVDSNLSDQPVLVQFVDAEMAGKALASGDDIIFTAADGVTRLDHELEAVNSGTGAVTAWVRVPLVDATDDTELFVYYGNASAVDQQDEEGVFGPDADLVFHGS